MSRRNLKAVKETPYLAKCEEGYFYFRRRIPSKFKHAFSQKGEVFVSLGETVKRKALNKHSEEKRKFEAILKQAKNDLKGATSCTSSALENKVKTKQQGLQKIDDELVEYIAKCWFIDELKKDHQKLEETIRLDRLTEQEREDHFLSIGGNWGAYLKRDESNESCERWKHCQELDEYIKILESGEHEVDLETEYFRRDGEDGSLSFDDDSDAIYESALGVCPVSVAQDFDGVKLSKLGESASKLKELMRRGRIEALKRYIEQTKSSFKRYDKDSFFLGLSRQTTALDPRENRVLPENKTIQEIEDEFEKRFDLEGKELSSQYKLVFLLLKMQLGADSFIRGFRLNEAQQMKEILHKLPKSFSLKGITLTELLESDKGSYGDITSPNYKHQIFATFNTVLDYARRSRCLGYNPLEDPTLSSAFPKVASDRKPFEVDQLNTLFGSERFKELRGDYPYNSDYWVPVLALYHGFRLGEICELETTDISCDEGHDWISIRLDSTTGQEKNIKTTKSHRNIPLHPIVHNLGFLDYLELARKSDSGLLFPEIKTSGKKNRKSNYFSKRFARFKKSVIPDSPQLTFHSFRHTFRTNISENTNDEVGVRLVGGWSLPKDAAFGYLHGYSPEKMIALIEQVSYNGLDLGNLRRPSVTT